MADLKAWVGRSETTSDVITLAPVRAMLAVLDDRETKLDEGAALPPMWHWLYFLPAAPQS